MAEDNEEERTCTWHIIGYTTSNKKLDDDDWFALDFRCYGKTFTISVRKKDLRNSPALGEEFDIMFNTLLSDAEADDVMSLDDNQDQVAEAEYDDQLSELETCHHQQGPTSLPMSILGCFDWAIKPCVAEIERLAPRPNIQDGDKVTLDFFFGSQSFITQLSAVQDKFLDPTFETNDRQGSEFSEDLLEQPGAWKTKTTFPIFPMTDVEVLPTCGGTDYILVDEPTHVRVHNQRLYFKQAADDSQDLAMVEIAKYEQMKQARLPADVRTSRLYGIVENDKVQIVGLLYEDLGDEAIPLDFEEVMPPETPENLRRRWIGQIQHTVEALHQNGIVWGDAKAGNILVDKNGRGDAWIIDFGGGYTTGWVDRENSNTVKGDLQGLARVIEYLETGQHVRKSVS